MWEEKGQEEYFQRDNSTKIGINMPSIYGCLTAAKGICDTQLDFVNKNSTCKESKRKRQ